MHRIDAFDALRLEFRVCAPLDEVVTSEATRSYASLFRFILRVQRATLALSGLWTRLHNPASYGAAAGAAADAAGAERGRLQEAHAWHVLRLHVHELRHFVSEVQLHFVAHVCDGCWGALHSAVDAATSAAALRRAHDDYLRSAMEHCLLHPAGLPTSSLISALLALALSLHRELCDESLERVRGGAWANLVEASRRQFSMLLRALSQQPLAPRTLFAMLPEHS